MALNVDTAAARLLAVTGAIAQQVKGAVGPTLSNASTAAGKLYELECLAEICRRLAHTRRFSLHLVGGSHLQFRTKGGPIDRKYARIEIRERTALIAELWTDLYFSTLSASRITVPPNDLSYFHELDIAIVMPNIVEPRYPKHMQVFAACECKDSKFSKGMIRQLLGLRRELSLFDPHAQNARFELELGHAQNSEPPSNLFLFCSDPKIKNYICAPAFFGISVEHL